MNEIQKLQLLQDVQRTDKILQQSKPDKTKLNAQAIVGFAAVPTVALTADVFDKKSIMKPVQKGGLATKARHAVIKFNKKIDSIKSFINTKSPKFTSFFAAGKIQGKVVRKPLGLAKKLVETFVKKFSGMRGSLKIASAISAVLIAAKYINRSGEIDGKHKATQALMRANNFAKLDEII